MKGKDFFDETDIMTDYFHCSHYLNIEVGHYTGLKNLTSITENLSIQIHYNMKLTNYDGTEASQKAYNIQESIHLIRNETIPALERNEYNLTDEENAERIANLRKYLNRLQYDLALEIGNNDAWQNVY